MTTPASTFTVGQVVIAAPETTTAPCPPGVTGLDMATCGAIASGEAADLTGKVFGPGEPPKLLPRDRLPGPVKTLLDDCDGSSTCKLVSYDFDASTGEQRNTLSHLISTRMTTAHNAGVFVKDGAGTPPLFTTIPGYTFEGMFSFNPDESPSALGTATTVVDERYCARACDDNTACGGFNYEQNGRKCTLFPKGKEYKAYKDGRVAFIKEDIAKDAKGSNPPGTNLTGTGVWCGVQNLNECNSDISNVITNNPEILSFTTSDLASCSACPAKTVSRLDATRWAVTNEIDTTTISSTATDTIAKLQYTAEKVPPPTTILTPGNFYKITPYLPGSSFQTQTFLYMKRIKKFEVYEQNRYWVMSGVSYSIPIGIYLTAEFLAALNDAGTPGTFSFDGSKFTWSGTFVRIDRAGTLELAGFVSRQESPTDPTTGLATMSGWPVSFDNVSGGFFTHGQYTQMYRADAGGMCADLGNPANNGFAARGALPEMTARKTRLFGSLGADFTNMAVEYSAVTLEPIPVDYVTNGFLLLNPANGKYTPASKWQRYVWNGDLGLTGTNDTSYIPRTEPRCSVVPRDTSYDVWSRTDEAQRKHNANKNAYIFNWKGPEFYSGCSRQISKPLPFKYTPQYNGFVFIITPATYSEFYAEATASVPDQPMIIKRPGEPVPYIFNPGTEEFRVLRFPSQNSFDKHLAANPSWGKYYSPYKSVGELRAMTLGEAEDCGPPAVGGPGGSYAFEEVTVDPWPALTVYDENFWNTVPYDDRVEIFDPDHGCADPDNPSAYIGGEYQKTVGTITFCELCPAGTYSPASNPKASSCTPCAQGTYCQAGSGAEQQCTSGYYCPTPAQQVECPAGSYCPVGAAAHIPCVAGDYCPAKSIAKQDCPAGSFCPQSPNNGPWGALKTMCPAGSYCAARSTAATPCVDSTRPGVAFYCPPGTRTLNECPAGYSCAGNSVATPCPAGNYCPSGSSAAITCPGDSTYVPLGLTNIIAISQLSQSQVLNQIFTQGSTCYNCPGTLKANDTKTGCICTGDLVWRSWTNECLPNCPIGQASNAAKTGCEICGDNTYTPEVGLAKCIPCATNFPGTVHNANKSGCECKGTITGGTLEWNSTWNRCKVKCDDNHIAWWSRCYPKTVTATPISYTNPAPTPQYGCPDESQNSTGIQAKTTVCTKAADSSGVTKGCLGAGCLCNFSCPSKWSQSSNLSFSGTNCRNNRSCYRGTIIRRYTCPNCWKPKYYKKSDASKSCPTGFSGSKSGLCDTPDPGLMTKSGSGLDENTYSAECQWDGNTDTQCGNCPLVPKGGYTGPVVDENLTTAMKMKCTMYNAPATPDPWGADGASPILDASGNIMLPSLVSQALSSIAPPAGDSNILCPRGSYQISTGSGVETSSYVGQDMPGNCAPCPIGTFCDAGYSAPFDCPAGAYCPSPSEFYPCTSGQLCPAKSTGWTTCPAKYYCPTSGSESLVCPAGKYCPGGTVTPIDCNTGEYCPAGSSSHDMCPAGSYCQTPSEIAPCPAGKYCPAGTSVARVCEAGNYCPAGSKVATPCDVGKYCDAGSSEQKPCDAGYYCPDPATRTACPAGTYNGTPGQTAASACLECPAGTTCPYDGASTLAARPNTTPITCAPGYYCPPGSATYNPCPNGWYCPTSSQKIQCPQGAGCPDGTITAGTWVPNQQLVTNGSDSCRTLCARGTGLPQQWNGAICVGTYTPGTTCETVNSSPVACNCQQSLGFGWIV